jgi:serine/threonine-protein kinase
VYRALDPTIGREIAVKVIPHQGDTERTARVLREARLVGNLSHPNIVTVFDVGIEDGQLFLVQELLLGSTLDAFLASQGAFPPLVAIEILIGVAEALAFAHSKGIVHRDVKPSNVFLLREGVVKLLDFGIARLVGDEERTTLTETGVFVGTIAYSAPEQFAGETVDYRTDIFCFGLLGYELLTGHRLVPGVSLQSVVSKVLLNNVLEGTSLANLQALAPASVASLLAHCVERRPDDRPQSMDEVLGALVGSLASLAKEEGLKSWSRRSASLAGPTGAFPQEVTIVPPLIFSAKSAETKDPVRPALRPLPDPLKEIPRPEVDWTLAGSALAITVFPHRIRRFTLHELIANGRSGNLYKAYDPVRGGLVGLKVVPLADEMASERLLRGGRIWLSLTHANLLRVLEIHPAEAGQPAVIVTELVDGADLATLIRQRSLSLGTKLEIALQVSQALAYLHDQGFIHREVVPRNVLVSHGHRTLLLDSGIARPANPDLERLTRTGMIVGDLRYMAPEQLRGMAEVRSDIFSLGALIYQLLMGEPPRLEDRAELQARLIADPGLPQQLTELVDKCLAVSPAERYASAHDVADSLRRLTTGAARGRRERQVVVLHGIRTYARWQRAFAEVADDASWNCRSDRWNFGYFSILRFLLPWSRSAKVEWFRRTYRDEFSLGVESGAELPSIVAHSFGTYILGNALLRYPYLRFNKVILCGSILPVDFPWATLLDSGQVQLVRNEYGASDLWTGLVEHFACGTGPSGRRGFESVHRRLEQERFEFTHSEYFERSHMEGRWIPFLFRVDTFVAPRQRVELAKPALRH